MSFKGFSWSDQSGGNNDEITTPSSTPTTTTTTTTSSSSYQTSPLLTSNLFGVVGNHPSSLSSSSSSSMSQSTIGPSSGNIFGTSIPRQPSTTSSSMFDTTTPASNNGYSSIFGGGTNNNINNNNNIFNTDDINIDSHNINFEMNNDFDIDILPDDDINLNNTDFSALNRSIQSRNQENFISQINSSVSGLTSDVIDDPNAIVDNDELELFRLQTLNKTDDHIFYEIIEKEATISTQDSLYSHLEMIHQFKSFFESKLQLLKYELERNYYLPNKKETERLIEQVQNEKNTWDILCRLYQDRDKDYPEERDKQTDIHIEGNITQVDVVAMNVKNDYQMRQNIIILNWLEEMSSNIKYSDEPFYWKKTLELLNNKKNTGGYVNYLDPDAPQRLNQKIDSVDEKDEQQFLSTLWSLIRCGNRELAVQFCELIGQHWRAQTLVGDSKFAGEMEIGNPYRNLWRSTCLTLSNNAINEYERAIYAILAGNVGNALPVCKNWYDYLWVYVRVLVDIKLSEELKTIPVPPTSYEDCPPLPTSSTFQTPTDILHIIRTNSPISIMKQSLEPYHLIQDRVISDDYTNLLQSLLEILNSGKQSPDFLRLAVSLVLFYRFRSTNFKPNPDENSPENLIIHSYIQYLISTQKNDLVALYTSFLGNDVQKTKLYSKFLEDITELEERQKCLGLAERYNLDTELITETVVSNINSKNKGTNARSLSTTTPEDVAKIDAIGWLCFNPQQRIEAILKSNLLIREFIENNKMDAAQQLLDALPKNSIAISKIESTKSETETMDIIKEFTNWSQYLEASRRIGIWFHNYSNKPKQPTLYYRLTGKESYAQKLDLERRKKEVEEEYGQWNQNNMLYGKDAIESIMVIIKQSWICPEAVQDGIFVNPGTNEKQIHALRVNCIPPLFFSLNQVLVGTEQYKKSSRICNLIADERLKWYNVFSREQLQDILGLVQKSLITMMEQNQEKQSDKQSNDILQYKRYYFKV